MPIFAKGLERSLPNGVDHWVGLLTEEPDEVAGTFDEVAAGGYARVVHSAWVTADNGDGRTARRNNGAVVFAALTDAETVFSHWGIFDAANAGNLIAAGPVLNGDGVPQPATVTTGNQPRFNDGDIKLLSSETAG